MTAINTIGKSDVMGRDGFTWWVGEVEDKKDPQQLGRVRVRVIGWYTGGQSKEAYLSSVKTEDLPWASVLLPTDQPGIKNTGTTTELEVGAQVLGFFLDGEEAQLPVVMGSFRGMRNVNDKKSGGDGGDSAVSKTTVASPDNAPDYPPAAKDGAGADVPGGAPFNKTGSAPADSAGGEATDRGILGKAEQGLAGHYATNPKVVPQEPQAISNGVQGPAGEGFEKDLERMLTEVGNLASGLASDPAGNLVSLITGKKVDNQILKKAMKGINLLMANGISGIMSWMKEILAKQIDAIVGAIKKFLTQIIPLGILNALLELADFIFSLFCGFEGQWILGLVKSALNDTAAFANQMADIIVSKVYDAIPASVTSTVNGIVGKVKSGLQKVASVARTLVKAIQVVKNTIGQFKQMGQALDSIFQFDFSKINWGSVVSLIIAILKMLLPKKDCGRKLRKSKLKFWLPLFGASTCDTVPEFMQREVSVDMGGNNTAGDIISNMYSNLDPFAMQVTTFMNGASVIQDNTKGKEKTIVSDTGGQTKISDNQGNTHYNQPKNETKIIGGDKCTTVKGNKCETIEGDYTLIVNGDFNLEVRGAFNEHTSNGVGMEGDDGAGGGSPGEQQAKSSQTKAADHEMNYQGNYGIQAANITFSAFNEFAVNAGNINNKATSMMNSISGEIVNECSWQTNLVNNVVFNMVGMLNILPGITGRMSIIKGPDLTMTAEVAGTSALPATQIRMSVGSSLPSGMVDIVAGTSGGHATLVACPAGGIGEFVTAGGGAIVNQVTSGVASYGVGTGLFAAGCGVGPTQIYGLPLLLN